MIQPDGRATAIWSDVKDKVHARRSGILDSGSQSALVDLLKQPELVRLLADSHDFEMFPEQIPRDPNLIVEHLNDTPFNLRIRRENVPAKKWIGWIEVTPPKAAQLVQLLEQATLALPLVGIPDGYLCASVLDGFRLRSLRKAKQIPIVELRQLPMGTHHALRSSATQPDDLVPVTQSTVTALRKIAFSGSAYVTVGRNTHQFQIYAP